VDGCGGKTCCFIGHRKIVITDELNKKMHDTVKNLIENEKVYTFLFGSKSAFNRFAYKIVTEIKLKYSQIRRIYVRAEFADISEDYKNYLLEGYEDTYYPDKIIGAGKQAYVERNYEMIEKSDFCVCYYDVNYQPPKRKGGNGNLIENQPKSGTKIAYEYAVKRHKEVINVLME